jgi:hypothetical protein
MCVSESSPSLYLGYDFLSFDGALNYSNGFSIFDSERFTRLNAADSYPSIARLKVSSRTVFNTS